MAAPSRAADQSGTAKRSEITDRGGNRKKPIHHGQTLAAWVGSLTAMVAVLIGGFAVAVASDEANNGSGRVDEWKRRRLLGVGADAVIPDFRDAIAFVDYLLGD